MKQYETSFHKMTMMSFKDALLLRYMWSDNKMTNTILREKIF
jgi:hypothetical protein